MRWRADAVLMGVALVWGASFVVVKGALAEAPPHWLLVYRFAAAGAAMALLFRGGARPARSAWAAGAGLGVILWAGFALQTLGLEHTTPARSGFLTATYVLMVPAFQWGLFRRRVPPRMLGAAALALLGLALLQHPTGFADVNRGDVLTLACAAAFALHVVVLGRLALRHRAVPLAALQMAGPGLLSLPLALSLEGPIYVPSPPVWAAVLFLGIVCSAGAFLGQTWAQQHTSPTRVALILSLESVFAALLSVAFAGERLTPGEWTGAGLVVLAVLVAQLPGLAPPADAPAGDEQGEVDRSLR